jgi:uncharacterized protein
MPSVDKVKRNDPCPCGSGKKYKQCCQPKDRAAQAERVAWERAVQNMRVALIGFAKETSLAKDLALGLGLFWQDRYTLETVQRMNVDESLRFFDWFAHDYALQLAEEPERIGKRLIEVYRQEVDDALLDKEAAVLDAWIDSPPGSAFLLEAADPEAGTVTLNDLLLPDRVVVAEDASAAKHGEVGQILLARPLTEHEHTRLAGATVILPPEEKEGLLESLAQSKEEYLAENEGAGDSQFLRERAYLLTHYALDWADRAGRPAVAAEDPDAERPGEQAVRRVVKWQQERVRHV